MSPDFFLSKPFVYGYCIAIFIFLSISYLILFVKSRALRGRLREFTTALRGARKPEQFAATFEDYHAKAREEFGLPWTEFVETLVRPESGTQGAIRNTVDASRYLNHESILFPHLPFGFFQSVPNLLTGFGILGTFVGLAAGIRAASSGLSSGNVVQITGSLQQLLSGASLAFYTSIAGITCSILFVIIERRHSRKLRLALDKWVGELEARLERITPQGIALQQLRQAERTTSQLERFNTDLVFAIENALEKKITGRLAPLLQSVLVALEHLRSQRSTQAAELIKRTSVQFTRYMQKQTKDQFDDMAMIVEKLNETLNRSSDQLSQSQEQVQATLLSAITQVQESMNAAVTAVADSARQRINEVETSMVHVSQHLSDNLLQSSTTAVQQVGSAYEVASEQIANAGVEAATQIQKSLQGLLDASLSLDRSTQQSETMLASMTTFVDRIDKQGRTLDSATRLVAGLLEPLRQTAVNVGKSSESAADTVVQITTQVQKIENVVMSLREHHSEVRKVWLKHQARFSGIDRSLGQVFLTLEDGLSRYCHQVENFAKELDKTTASTIQGLAGLVFDLNESVEDLSDTLALIRPPRG